MFLFTKLALVTCAFYLGINILLDATMWGITLWKGGFRIYFSSRIGWLGFFGVIWLLSASLSWRIVMAPILAKIKNSN